MILHYSIIIILSVLLVFLVTKHGRRTRQEPFSSPDQPIPIHIVSLKARYNDRLKPLLSRIKNDARYTVRRVYGFDGNKDLIENFLGRGQIGCWRSHVEHWKDIKIQQEPFALVLEDDANIRLPQMLPFILDVLQELPKGWHICYLGGKYADTDNVERVSDHLVKSTSRMWNSHAYLISREGASQLLELSKRFNSDNHISSWDAILPVDDWMTHSDRKLMVFKTEPELVSFVDDNIHDTYL